MARHIERPHTEEYWAKRRAKQMEKESVRVLDDSATVFEVIDAAGLTPQQEFAANALAASIRLFVGYFHGQGKQPGDITAGDIIAAIRTA